MLGPTNAINEVGPSFCYANGEEEEPMTAIAAWDEFSFPPSVVFQPIKPLENKKKESSAQLVKKGHQRCKTTQKFYIKGRTSFDNASTTLMNSDLP